jgi:tetraacyldisaccharide 4'-kinase
VALSPLSWAFHAAVAGRNLLFDADLRPARRLQIPVLSVGNITVGGTGKTPLVALLARCLTAAGRRPAVVSRGYGGLNEKRPGSPVLMVSDGKRKEPLATAAEAGDEPVLLASMLAGVPVLVCRDRYEGGRVAHERCGAGLVILDDGFQHRALHRDADLVALDAGDPLGGGRMLPAGILREPPRPVRLRLAGPRGGERPVSELAGVSVAAFAGLARPESLLETLESLGARVLRFDALPDHHSYSSEEIARLMEAGKRSGADLVLTTSKDLVRLPGGANPAGQRGLAVLEIEMDVENLEGLIRHLLDLCLPPSPGRRDSVEPGR